MATSLLPYSASASPPQETSTTPPPIPGRPPAARMETTGNIPHEDGNPPFDIVATYRSLLSTDPDLTMPVAAIEALVSLLVQSPTLSTISETLDLLATNAAILRRSIPNPISLSAGTDLFQRYIISSLRGGSAGATGDFGAIRAHLLSNGRLFVSRAKEARMAIAKTARKFVREDSTILTNGGSRVVGAVLKAAAESHTRETGAPRFKVIYACGAPYANSASGEGELEGAATVAELRALGVPVATISEAAVAYAMGKVSMALVGAEGVVENGGIISRMGTYQMAQLAKAAGKPVYVVVESHKFVRLFPLNQYDLGVEQNVLDFTTENAENAGTTGLLTPKADQISFEVSEDQAWCEETPIVKDPREYFDRTGSVEANIAATNAAMLETQRKRIDAVDYTPPDLISALVTESGVLTPSAVSEELIKIW